MYDIAFCIEAIMNSNVLTQIGIWSNVCSAFFAMVTAIIALIALNQWKKQYEENKFLRFVDAIIEYNNCLIRAPKLMADDKDNFHRKSLSVAGNEMNMRWLICLKTKRGRKNEALIEAMKSITINHDSFLEGKTSKLELAMDSIVTIAFHSK